MSLLPDLCSHPYIDLDAAFASYQSHVHDHKSSVSASDTAQKTTFIFKQRTSIDSSQPCFMAMLVGVFCGQLSVVAVFIAVFGLG